MRAKKLTTAIGSLVTFLSAALPAYAAGASPSATGSGLPQAGAVDTTILLVVSAALLVFLGTVGILSKQSRNN